MKPKPGDTVTIVDHDNLEHTGVVVDLLSKQFTYELESGKIRYAFYTDEWRLRQ